MTDARFVAASTFPGTARTLYDWHSRPGALERLMPPWERSAVLSRTGTIEPGSEVVLQLHAGPVPYRWHARHLAAEPGVFFRDVQLRGPFARWTHTHRFTDTADGARLEDEIDYALPGVNVWTTDPAGGGRSRSGTSYAVPYMVALASQTLAQRVASRDVLLDGRLGGLADLGDPGRDPVFGYGKPRFDRDCR